MTGLLQPHHAGSYWQILGETDGACPQGTPVQKGQRVRLWNPSTAKVRPRPVPSQPSPAPRGPRIAPLWLTPWPAGPRRPQWLHSHRIPAPISSSMMEVSCYGTRGASNADDVWIVEPETKELTQGRYFRLKHASTGGYLSLSPKKFNRPIAGQHEIYTSLRPETRSSSWQMVEGVRFPPREEVQWT